jgi:hypothetical protein
MVKLVRSIASTTAFSYSFTMRAIANTLHFTFSALNEQGWRQNKIISLIGKLYIIDIH